ncbi:1-acyl-sn-glycerol-3-phosphate acyltransferase [Mastigocoleus testarum]|uniref:Glycerol acyltransferase n=1 Tax=Mastigocoleus testarum BC008 TaxID=371196 RepID=A0A0V7ZPS9_9CYAN|nr:1-acyl-sn-glycerol-3-phosphate acyltransferase [Mastigocoleus testarum]KST66386.1 glycerol acyltransferase [Mastigocoleus testarum BC008]KST66707.1 glycerol acyltransferase [Mastigocoleus testarum BC008]
MQINRHPKNSLNSEVENISLEGYKFNWFDWFCVWYPPGWLILFNRHWQHYHEDPDGWNWLEYLLFLIPAGFYIALFIRWLRLGFRPPKRRHSAFNPQYQQAFREEILAPIVKSYFRAELHLSENLPKSENIIFAMNHAGMCFPWDFVVLGYLLAEKKGWIVQPLAGVSLFEHPWMIWWLPSGWSQVLGGIKAQKKDFQSAVEQNRILLYAPEGLRGPSKGWGKRYQLEKFDPSFIHISQKNCMKIVPVICIGNENLHPWTINISRLQRKLQNLLKLPFLPLSPLLPIFMLFPSMGVWAAKSRLHYFIESWIEAEAIESLQTTEETNLRKKIYCQAQKLRAQMQEQINIRLKLIKP